MPKLKIVRNFDSADFARVDVAINLEPILPDENGHLTKDIPANVIHMFSCFYIANSKDVSGSCTLVAPEGFCVRFPGQPDKLPELPFTAKRKHFPYLDKPRFYLEPI